MKKTLRTNYEKLGRIRSKEQSCIRKDTNGETDRTQNPKGNTKIIQLEGSVINSRHIINLTDNSKGWGYFMGEKIKISKVN